MAIITTVHATCDYSRCGVELDPAALPVRSSIEVRLPNGATKRWDGCACSVGHFALAADEAAAVAQAALDEHEGTTT